jgi:hypothetical protein
VASSDRYRRNPDYGSGVYRRRIRLHKSPGLIVADLLDDYHDMACTLRHDGVTIVKVDAHIRRAPFTTCPGAVAVARELEGVPLATGRKELFGGGRVQRNCMHIFDLIVLAMSQAQSVRQATELEFIVPDMADGGMIVSIVQDGDTVLQWTIGEDRIIAAPPECSGQPMFGGFTRWAEALFDGFQLELVLHLQKAVFVAQGRRYLLRDGTENPVRDEPERLGVCFTFSEPQFSRAKPIPDYARDFSLGFPRS